MFMCSQSFHKRLHSASFDSSIWVDHDLRGIIVRSQVPRFLISVDDFDIMSGRIGSKEFLEL